MEGRSRRWRSGAPPEWARALPGGFEVEATREAIRESLADGDASLRRVADSLQTTPRTLQRALARRGTTFSAELAAIRLLEAERMLAARKAQLPVSEIARRVGFRRPAHFSAFFRRARGMSPREWRRRQDGSASPSR